VNLFGFFIFKLVQATASAAITEGFPFLG